MAIPAIAERLSAIDTPARLSKFVARLSEDEKLAILGDWSLWQLPHQAMPGGDWRRWIARMGRGAGKTYTGARNTNDVARDRKKIRRGEIGLIGRTWTDARSTMVEGPSGILQTAPPDFKPLWEPGKGCLTWPNGVTGRIFSADKPESMRGPNWAWVWADEPAHWPNLKRTWLESIEPALRIGWARCLMTTTPLPDSYMKELEAMPDTVTTRASMYDNGLLPQKVRDMFKRTYEGTRRGRQELYGEYLETNERALWKPDDIDQHRVEKHGELRRIVVGVDPSGTSNENSDETGIIVSARSHDGHGYVLQDRSGIYSPSEWARTAIAAYHRFQADRIVCEVNYGGDMVEQTIRGLDNHIPVKQVNASRGKTIRAEPVAAMYERGLIHHVGHLQKLETQMCEWDPTATNSSKSPDRMDALVWSLHELFLQEKNPVGPIRAYL